MVLFNSAGVGDQYGGPAQRTILRNTNSEPMFSDVQLLKFNPNSSYTRRYSAVLERLGS